MNNNNETGRYSIRMIDNETPLPSEFSIFNKAFKVPKGYKKKPINRRGSISSSTHKEYDLMS